MRRTMTERVAEKTLQVVFTGGILAGVISAGFWHPLAEVVAVTSATPVLWLIWFGK